MEGQGKASHFLGIETALDNAQIVVLPVPFDVTTSYMHGTDLGPKALIEASRNLELFDIETSMDLSKLGIHTANPLTANSCEELQIHLKQKVAKYLSQGKFVVTVGGEHSISLAPILAYAESHGKISILQLDAHADLAMAYEGNPYSHASVIRRVKEHADTTNVVSVGIRSLSEEESQVVDREKTFFAHTLWENDDWMDQAIDLLSDKVYITLDLDVFDSSLMPATGTPEPGGLFFHQVQKFLHKVAKKREVIGFDVVELLPIQNFWAPDYLAAKVLYKLLNYIFEGKKDADLKVCTKTLQTF